MEQVTSSCKCQKLVLWNAHSTDSSRPHSGVHRREIRMMAVDAMWRSSTALDTFDATTLISVVLE
jgi:hypothetical protein